MYEDRALAHARESALFVNGADTELRITLPYRTKRRHLYYIDAVICGTASMASVHKRISKYDLVGFDITVAINRAA